MEAIKWLVFLGISINTLKKWVGKALFLDPDYPLCPGSIYNIDELQAGVGKRQHKVWITYPWDVEVKRAIALKIGGRSTADLRWVVEKILLA